MKRYNPSEIEPKWQQWWEEHRTYKADDASDKPKYYALSFFPYPSGIGLHIGHTRNFTITDAAARFMRMTGHEVLHPMGWDSFGLPAENYAIKTGVPPQVTTKENTDNFRRQGKRLGLSIDWSREFASSDPSYYKWTQWFFKLLLERGLAYQKESAQFWCPKCKTVLANEQVVNGGFCWRHEDTRVEKKLLKQWFFKITDYADRLDANLDDLDWPDGIKHMQRNWIGRSKGAEVQFKVDGKDEKLTVFTTRPDTIFGATFMVLAPEHKLVAQITTDEQREAVEKYIRETQVKTEVDRMDMNRKKTGVFTGAYVVNPATHQPIPIWIADYVLAGYGTGAIMAVPGHDQRDYEFATTFNLPITYVVEPTFGKPQGDEVHKDSAFIVVRNQKTNKVIVLDWGPRQDRYGGKMLIGGATKSDEDFVLAAQREIIEETGYKNFKLVKESEFSGHGYFYSNTKNKNIEVSGKGLLFDLVDEERTESNLDEGEKDKFTVTWEPIEKVAGTLDDGLHEAFYRHLVLGEQYTGEGQMARSGDYNGLTSDEMREKIVADLSAQGVAQERTNYKIRDWLISRQRYWGAPIPVVHCPEHGAVAVPDDQLPVVLPDLKEFEPSGDGRSPLAKVTDWVNTTCPTCGGPAKRETDTMDGFACSSWYFLRFADPHNNKVAFNQALAEHWLPVDMYVGGAEHAVMHLLYARMWTMVMYDAGLVSFDEPFKALRNQGMLLAPDGAKFSKSAGNGVAPEEIIDSGYGADALRATVLFLAPFDQKTPWSPEGLGGVHRFLSRVWTLVQEYKEKADSNDTHGQADTRPLKVARHKAIKRVTTDMHELGFNTAIAALMEYTNELYKLKKDISFAVAEDKWGEALRALAQMLAPFAPHLAEELWRELWQETTIHDSQWPVWDESYLVTDSITIVVQVNGKVRANITVARDADEAAVQAAAEADENIQQYLADKKTTRVIYVPGRLINFALSV